MNKFIIAVVLLALTTSVQAEFYIEAGVEVGGDTLISTT